MEDLRKDSARYFDAGAGWTDDIPFYIQHIPADDPNVLELGCGTGRVLIPLAQHCQSIVGVDVSEAMLDRCREKLKEGASKGNVTLICEDTADLALGRKFGLITAPFRVFQNIESDEAVASFFECIRRHLSPQGTCILNVFKSRFQPEELLSRWQETEESFNWEQPYGSGLLKHFERRKDIQRDPLVLYPELIYRYYENDSLVDEVRFVPPMRVYYEEEFKDLIRAHGFEIVETWGGYRDEAYGEGTELVVKFRLA